MFLLCTIYFIWYVHHRILLVSDSLRIVLHYYIQYEVRFSLSYFKKEIYLTINIQIFPFLLSHFAYIVLHSLPYHLSKICMVLSWLEQCHESSHPRDPLLAPIYPKMSFKFYFVYNAKSTDMIYCCIVYINFPRQLLS